jgi:hypothetical protein
MKRVTISIILAAAVSALAACATQAPAGSTGTGAAQTNLAGTSAPPVAQANGAVTSSASATTATAQNAKYEPPSGWRRVMMHGEERYCHKDRETGSRVQSGETCLTKDQLEQMQQGTQDFIQQVQRQGGLLSGQGGTGGAMGH